MVDEVKEEKMTNSKFSRTNQEFKDSCSRANIEPTTRQASKWRSKKGKAWDFRTEK
jgi:hypothetical protein